MDGNLLLQKDDHRSQDIGHCHIIASVPGHVLNFLVFNNISLNHPELFRSDTVCLKILLYGRDGVLVQVRSEDLAGPQF